MEAEGWYVMLVGFQAVSQRDWSEMSAVRATTICQVRFSLAR
jgi:hypothetical protein